MNITDLKILFVIICLCGAVSLHAQTEPAGENASSVKTEDGSAAPEKKVKPAAEKPKKLKAEKPKPKEIKKEIDKIEEERGDADLLTIKDGDFIYSRIPDIKIKAVGPNGKSDMVKLSESEGKDKQAVDKGKKDEAGEGLLGLSGSATDIFVKVFFVILIIVIFLLYRARSRVSSSGGVGVLRSIPKK